MRITSSAVSLNVEDVAASSGFLVVTSDSARRWPADGFASLARDDAGMNVIFLRRACRRCPPTNATTTPAA